MLSNVSVHRAVFLVASLISIGLLGACQSRAFAPPPLDAIPNDERGAQIHYGYQLVVNTQEHARGHVGNALNCTNCHLDAGRKLNAAPFLGLISVYPEYRSRNARMNTIEDRLDDCFERSLNGKALPPRGPKSYNIGAGMARISLAAGFIKANMPVGHGGTLGDDEAYDLASFINGQLRPDFPGKVHDWPKGGKPADSPY